MQAKSALVPPFKADVVGSLLRPQGLLDARARLAKGELSREALWDLEQAMDRAGRRGCRRARG